MDANRAYDIASKQLTMQDTAAMIFKESFDPKGQLDLKALKQNIHDVAENWPRFDENYVASDAQWRSQKFVHVRDALNHEVRELIVGIAQPSRLTQVLQDWNIVDKPDVQCSLPAGFNAKDLNRSMADAGVKCHKR